MASYSSGSSLPSLTEEHKRWLVIGIALNKILIPQIGPSVEHEVNTEYNRLKTSHGIHSQSASGCLRRWPTLLHYENINDNEVYPKLCDGRYNYSLFDYRVMSCIDFAKLYLEKNMCNAFDDHPAASTDASAVLHLLSRVPVFSAAVQAVATDIRVVGNTWAQCDFSKWDEEKFQQSFMVMEKLARVMALPADGKSKLIRELEEWKSRGIKLSINSPEQQQLILPQLKSLQDDVIKLSEKVVKGEAQELQNVAVMLEEMEQRLRKSQSWFCGECNEILTKFHKFWQCSNQHTTCDNCAVDHWWDTNSYTCTQQDCKKPLHVVHPSDTTRELVYVFVDIYILSEEDNVAFDIRKVIDAVANNREVAMVTLYRSKASSSSDSVLDKESAYEWTLIIKETFTKNYLVTDIVKVVSDKSLKKGKIVIVNGDPYMIPAIEKGLSKNWPFEIWMYMYNNHIPIELEELQRKNASMLEIFSLESAAWSLTSLSYAAHHTVDIL